METVALAVAVPGEYPVRRRDPIVRTFATGTLESCCCPPVPMYSGRSSVVTPDAGPVVSPAPDPANALLLVAVVADPAIRACPEVAPEMPVLLLQPVQVPLTVRFVATTAFPLAGVRSILPSESELIVAETPAPPEPVEFNVTGAEGWLLPVAAAGTI